MCGICGFIGSPPSTNPGTNAGQAQMARAQILEAMKNRIVHRGPDDDGSYIDDTAALGFRRLSIIDLDHGHQPMANEDGSIIVTFNGEIYNYQEIRSELISRGHRFATSADTEVLVHGWEEYGEALLDRLRGMFAFVIWDANSATAFGARDFFGIKPFYYSQLGDTFVYGSEIKSILAYPGIQPKLNLEALEQYLSFQYSALPETFFKGIFKLGPGECFRFQDGKLSLRRYFDPLPAARTVRQLAAELQEVSGVDGVRRDATTGAAAAANGVPREQRYAAQAAASVDAVPEPHASPISRLTEQDVFDTTVERVKAVMAESVQAHMIADVEVGSLLSSGIDSSYITALYPNQRTYTVGFETADGVKYNEISYAEQAAAEMGKSNTSRVISPEDYWQAIPRIMYHMDEPLADPSAVALFFLDELVARDVKVVLSGEGADEFFGGYPIYHEPLGLAGFQRLPRGLRRALAALARAVPFRFKGKSFLERAAKTVEERYISNAYLFSVAEREALLKAPIGAPPPESLTQPFYAKAAQADDTGKMQYIDYNFWLPGDILLKADKMSMAHSLESRVPFLDLEVFALANTLPLDFRVNSQNTKLALRAAALEVLPERIAQRPKLGFPVPMRVWLAEERWYLQVRQQFEAAAAREFFHTSMLVQLLDDHRSGKADNSRKIWNVYVFLVWYGVFFGDDMPQSRHCEPSTDGAAIHLRSAAAPAPAAPAAPDAPAAAPATDGA